MKERGAVMLVGIVFVISMLPEFAEFHRVNPFVVVHRPLRQPWTTQCQRQSHGHQQTQSKPFVHSTREKAKPPSSKHQIPERFQNSSFKLKRCGSSATHDHEKVWRSESLFEFWSSGFFW